MRQSESGTLIWDILIIDDDIDKARGLERWLTEKLQLGSAISVTISRNISDAVEFYLAKNNKSDIIFQDMELTKEEPEPRSLVQRAANDPVVTVWKRYQSSLNMRNNAPLDNAHQGLWGVMVFKVLMPASNIVVYTNRPDIPNLPAIKPFVVFGDLQDFFRVIANTAESHEQAMTKLPDIFPLLVNISKKLLDKSEQLQWILIEYFAGMLYRKQVDPDEIKRIGDKMLSFIAPTISDKMINSTFRCAFPFLSVINSNVNTEETKFASKMIIDALRDLCPVLPLERMLGGNTSCFYELVHSPEFFTNQIHELRSYINNEKLIAREAINTVPFWFNEDVPFTDFKRSWAYAYCYSRNPFQAIREVSRHLSEKWKNKGVTISLNDDSVNNYLCWTNKLASVESPEKLKEFYLNDVKSQEKKLLDSLNNYVFGAGYFERMLDVLVANLLKFCSSSPKAEIRVDLCSDCIHLWYQDNSNGFSDRNSLDTALCVNPRWDTSLLTVKIMAQVHACQKAAFYLCSGEAVNMLGNCEAIGEGSGIRIFLSIPRRNT